jgi:hypothetical protein
MIKDTNLLLANIISIFHLIVILFMIITPFFDIPMLLFLHIMFALCLMIHWYSNSNACSLTLLEHKLRGIRETNTYSYKFIAPIYDISNTDLSNIIWIITLILLYISINNLLRSKTIKNTIKEYHKQKINNNFSYIKLLNKFCNVD